MASDVRQTPRQIKLTSKNTIRLAISADSVLSPEARKALAQAAEVIRSGGTVALPTETVYGLGANALDPMAVEGIFVAKQRPAWDPMIVHIANTKMLDQVVERVSEAARERTQLLIAKFWPGPLTLLLPKLDVVPSVVTAGRKLVGVRMPAHPVALALIETCGLPLAAPSANRFGHTSPTTAQHVLDDLDGRIDMVVDAGPAWCGIESTVIEVRDHETILYRPGAVASKEIEAIAGPVVLYRLPMPERAGAHMKSLPSPGVDMRHYAPNAKVIPFEMDGKFEDNGQARWLRAVLEQSQSGAKVGVLLPAGWELPDKFSGVQYAWGRWGDDLELARRLYAGLRALDAMGAELILCPLPPGSGLGAAVRDRLLKAARKE